LIKDSDFTIAELQTAKKYIQEGIEAPKYDRIMSKVIKRADRIVGIAGICKLGIINLLAYFKTT